jgi:chromosome segregation ATPase
MVQAQLEKDIAAARESAADLERRGLECSAREESQTHEKSDLDAAAAALAAREAATDTAAASAAEESQRATEKQTDAEAAQCAADEAKAAAEARNAALDARSSELEAALADCTRTREQLEAEGQRLAELRDALTAQQADLAVRVRAVETREAEASEAAERAAADARSAEVRMHAEHAAHTCCSRTISRLHANAVRF